MKRSIAQAFNEGKLVCTENFWGQTALYIRADVGKKLGREFLERTAKELYGDRYTNADHLHSMPDVWLYELPTCLRDGEGKVHFEIDRLCEIIEKEFNK